MAMSGRRRDDRYDNDPYCDERYWDERYYDSAAAQWAAPAHWKRERGQRKRAFGFYFSLICVANSFEDSCDCVTYTTVPLLGLFLVVMYCILVTEEHIAFFTDVIV